MLVDVAPEQRWDYVVVVNLSRRHLTIKQRRVMVREYLGRHPEQTNRAAGKATGVSAPTVGAIRRQMGQKSPRRAPHPPAPRLTEAETADHRRQVWFEAIFGYASDGQRYRWESGRVYLTTPAPTSDAEVVELLQETARATQRLLHERPFRTMRTHALR